MYLIFWSDLVLVGPSHVLYAAKSCQVLVTVLISTVVPGTNATNSKTPPQHHASLLQWFEGSAMPTCKLGGNFLWMGPNAADNKHGLSNETTTVEATVRTKTRLVS